MPHFRLLQKFLEIFAKDIELFKDKIDRKPSVNSTISDSSSSRDNHPRSQSSLSRSNIEDSSVLIDSDDVTETISRRLSSNSLTSLATHSVTSQSTRRSSSHSSLELSVECSGDLTNADNTGTGKGRRLRALTASLLSSLKLNKDTGQISVYQVPQCISKTVTVFSFSLIMCLNEL